jgi:hypothetical protein
MKQRAPTARASDFESLWSESITDDAPIDKGELDTVIWLAVLGVAWRCSNYSVFDERCCVLCSSFNTDTLVPFIYMPIIYLDFPPFVSKSVRYS